MPERSGTDYANIQLIKLRKTSLLFVTILSSCLLLLVPLLGLVIRNTAGAIAAAVGFLITILSMSLIRRGRSRLGTALTLFILLSLIMPVCLQYSSQPEVFPVMLITTTTLSFMIILPAGILVHRYFMAALTVYYCVAMGFIMYRSRIPVVTGRVPIILATYLFVCVLIYALSQLQNSLIDDTAKAAAESEAGAASLRSVISDIGRLKRSIDSALETTRASIGRINAIVGAYITRVDELSRSSSALGTEITETHDNLGRVREHLERSVRACSTQTRLVETGVARNREMLEATERITASIRTADEFNRTLLERTSLGVRELESSLRSIHGLHEYQNRIRDIVQVIGDVSSRTSLLSINASIEAAHSGAAGKGFKVVANEIKKLAEQSAVHTKDISEVVLSMVGAIDASIASATQVESTLIDVVKEIEEFRPLLESVVESGDSLQLKNRSIFENFSEISSNTEVVDTATKEHGREFESFERTIGELIEYFPRMAELSASLEASNEEASALLKSLDEVSGKNEAVSEEIESLLRTVSR